MNTHSLHKYTSTAWFSLGRYFGRVVISVAKAFAQFRDPHVRAKSSDYFLFRASTFNEVHASQDTISSSILNYLDNVRNIFDRHLADVDYYYFKNKQ